MRRKEGFITREVADQTVIVPTGRLVVDFNCIITLNSSGRWIWDNLDRMQTLEELTRKMTDHFDIDENTAHNDINAFLKELHDLGLIEF